MKTIIIDGVKLGSLVTSVQRNPNTGSLSIGYGSDGVDKKTQDFLTRVSLKKEPVSFVMTDHFDGDVEEYDKVLITYLTYSDYRLFYVQICKD